MLLFLLLLDIYLTHSSRCQEVPMNIMLLLAFSSTIYILLFLWHHGDLVCEISGILQLATSKKLKINNDNNMATPRSLCSLVMTTVAHFCHLFTVERQQKRATFLIGENSVLVVVGCCAATFQADFVY